MRSASTKGVIYYTDKRNIKYNVCEIEYVIWEDDSYKYIFSPVYSVIDMIEEKDFQGIPGINLDKRKKEYIRENMTPTFIAERSPQQSREDVWELLDEVDMDYLDRLEWLMRTDKVSSADSLRVRRHTGGKNKEVYDDPNLNDRFMLRDFDDIHKNNNELIKGILEIICSGAELRIGDYEINDGNRKMNYQLFNTMYIRIFNIKRRAQKKGIESAKKEEKYSGRKRIKLNPFVLEETIKDFEEKKISEKEAIDKLGISKSTFYRRLKEYRKNMSSASKQVKSK